MTHRVLITAILIVACLALASVGRSVPVYNPPPGLLEKHSNRAGADYKNFETGGVESEGIVKCQFECD